MLFSYLTLLLWLWFCIYIDFIFTLLFMVVSFSTLPNLTLCSSPTDTHNNIGVSQNDLQTYIGQRHRCCKLNFYSTILHSTVINSQYWKWGVHFCSYTKYYFFYSKLNFTITQIFIYQQVNSYFYYWFNENNLLIQHYFFVYW